MGISGVVLLVLFINLIPIVWYSPEIRARVASPAGAPVEGAVVVASWNIEAPMNGRSLGQLALAEVRTDREGWFRIPAWGPKYASSGAVRETDPTIRVFHPGFAPLILSNAEVGMRAAPPVIRFRYQDQTLVLPPWPRSIEQRKASINLLMDSLLWILQMRRLDGKCPRALIPGLMQTMLQVKRELDPTGIDATVASIEQFDPISLARLPPCI